MTISELAKIALEEKRVVRATCALYDAKQWWPIDIDPHSRDACDLDCEDLAADDWYEVKE